MVDPNVVAKARTSLTKWVTDSNLPPSSVKRIYDLLDESVGTERALSLADHYRIPGLRAQPWWDCTEFEWIRRLGASASIIVDECKTVSSAALAEHPEGRLVDGRWSILSMYQYGLKNESNCRMLPETTRIIEQIPTASTACYVYLSSLAPRSWIKPHKGPTNCRLRCHFGLVVPDDCWMRVDSTTRRWEVGKCLVFDDSFEHEVRNDSSLRREVLIIDFWHPDLTLVEQKALELLTGMLFKMGLIKER